MIWINALFNESINEVIPSNLYLSLGSCREDFNMDVLQQKAEQIEWLLDKTAKGKFIML